MLAASKSAICHYSEQGRERDQNPQPAELATLNHAPADTECGQAADRQSFQTSPHF